MPVTNVTAGGTQYNVPSTPVLSTAGVSNTTPNPALASQTAASTAAAQSAAAQRSPSGSLGPMTNQQPSPPPTTTTTTTPDSSQAMFDDPTYLAHVAAINYAAQNGKLNADATLGGAQATYNLGLTQLTNAQPRLHQDMLDAAERGGYLGTGAVGYNSDQLSTNYINSAAQLRATLDAAQTDYNNALRNLATTQGTDTASAVIDYLTRAAAALPDQPGAGQATSPPTTGGGKAPPKGKTPTGKGKTPPKTPPKPPSKPSPRRQTAAQRAAAAKKAAATKKAAAAKNRLTGNTY